MVNIKVNVLIRISIKMILVVALETQVVMDATTTAFRKQPRKMAIK